MTAEEFMKKLITTYQKWNSIAKNYISIKTAEAN